MKYHVETSIFRAIRDAVSYAHQACRAVAISGAPGLGKTHALTWIAEREHSARYWSVTTAGASLKAATKSILAALGEGSAHQHTYQLWEQLEWTLGRTLPGTFLMVDEAHRLPLNVLVEIVDLPEKHGFPVVIAGNEELLKQTRVKSAAFEQISSRCAKQLVLRKPLPADLNLLAADFDVLGEDARAAAINYGLNTSIRELLAMLETARGLAGRAPVRLMELRQAAAFQRGDSDTVKLLKPAA